MQQEYKDCRWFFFVCLAWLGVVVYVLHHFISKYW